MLLYSQKARLRSLGMAMLVVLCGCPTPRSGAPPGTTIAVEEFVVPRDVVVRRYSGSPEAAGLTYAHVLAEQVTRLGYQAVVVPQGVPPTGDLVVSGRIAAIDGGNTAKRLLIGLGTGRSEFAVHGTVTRADGSSVGAFTERRTGDGWGEEGALGNAMGRSAKFVGQMISTGDYHAPAEPSGFFLWAESLPPPAVRLEPHN